MPKLVDLMSQARQKQAFYEFHIGLSSNYLDKISLNYKHSLFWLDKDLGFLSLNLGLGWSCRAHEQRYVWYCFSARIYHAHQRRVLAYILLLYTRLTLILLGVLRPVQPRADFGSAHSLWAWIFNLSLFNIRAAVIGLSDRKPKAQPISPE